MRPLGGIFFGYIGDKLGRKISLTISIVGMATSTLMIGILPGFNEIGYFAPAILVIIRLFQGLCVGGEGAGVAIFVLEHLEGYRPGLIGSIVMASNMVGTLVASLVGLVVDHFCQDLSYCWRIPFWLGGVMGLVGLYMRYQINETPVFEAYKASRDAVKHPIVEAFKTHWQRMLVVTMVGGATSAVAYTVRGYFKTLFEEVLHYSNEESLYFTAISLFTMIVFLPFFGVVADRVGYRRFFYLVNFVVIITVMPIYGLFTMGDHNIGHVFLGICLFGMLAAAICAPAYPYAIKAFEVELRFSGVAFSWNLGNALMGGTTPLISTYLTKHYGVVSPSYYLMAVAALFIVVSFATRKHKH